MLQPTIVSQVLNIFLLSATVLAIGMGLFVWWQNKKSTLYVIFAFLTLSVAIWQVGTYMMLQNCAIERLVVFWDRFIYVGVVFIPSFVYHFFIELTGKIKERKHYVLLFLSYPITFIFLLLSRTNYFVKDVFYYRWGCHTIAQPGHHLFLAFLSFYVLLSLYLLYNTWKKTKNPVLRIQVKYVFFSFLLLAISIVEFLPAYKVGIFPFGYFFPLIWLLILAYAITRYQLLNVKVIATDILVTGIVFVILVFTILSENIYQFIGRGIFLVLIVIFGWLTIRGMHREIREKEILKQMVKERTKELERAKNIAEARAKEIEKRKEDLEKFYKLTVGRELRMIELKQKIKELEEKIKKEEK
ncbi:hypothetical protein J7K44_02700 [bacterium]|nr:hypothetical protein [bacterium]